MCNQSGLLLVAVGMSVLSVAATIAFLALPMYSMLSVRPFLPPIPPLRAASDNALAHTHRFPRRPLTTARSRSFKAHW